LFQPALAQKFVQVTDLSATWVGNRVRLTWTDANSNEAGFDIFRSDGNDHSFYLITTVGPANPNGSWDDYDAGTGGWWGWGTYYYYVQPFEYSGQQKIHGPESNVASIDPPPAAPQNLVFTNANTEWQHPHLEWNENTETDMASYQVWRQYWERFSGYQEIVQIASVQHPTTSFTDNTMYTASHENGYYLVYWIKAVDNGGNVSPSSNSVGSFCQYMPKLGRTDEAQKLKERIPVVYELSQNYPNPFNPSTTIQYQLAEESSVRLTIYDMLGRQVSVLVNKMLPAGFFTTTWDGKGDDGSKVGSGAYFCELRAEGKSGVVFNQKKMMVLMK
jgi:hypothetical protein